jgi:hypothetical protein
VRKERYNVKRRPDFFYQGTVPGSPVQYSEAFVEWLLKQLEKDPDFFATCREKAKDCPKSDAKGACHTVGSEKENFKRSGTAKI